MAFTSSYRVKNIKALGGGLNDSMESTEIADNEMADCENFTVDETAMITSPGYIAGDDNPKEGPYYAIFEFKKSDGSTILIRQRQDKLEYSTDISTFYGTGWTECILPTTGSPAETISLTQTTPTFAVLNNTIVFTNGTDSVMSSTNGINWTISTTGSPAEELPKAYFVINNGKNRLIYARTDSDPSIIYWSDINDPTTIQSASFQYISPNDNMRITGVGKTPNGEIIVFKDDAFYSIDDVTSGLVGVNYIGAFKLANHHTICTTEDSIICFGWDGIYELQGGVMRLVSGRIKQNDRNLIFTSPLVRAAYFKREYHLAMPNADVSQGYNSQEYVLYKNLGRNDTVQPYVITRNKRYIGCYGVVDAFLDSVSQRRGALFFGDSRSSTGSPAEGGYTFAWVNSYRQTQLTQGLAGEAQEAYFTTKFFTEDVPFYTKRFTKFFAYVKLENTATIEMSYRTSVNGSWISANELLESFDLDFILEDETEGGFDEGFGFSLIEDSQATIDIDTADNPRGIQFRVKTNQTEDVYILGLAYKFLIKPNFR